MRHCARHRHQQAGYGVVAATVFFRQIVQAQAHLELANWHQAVDQPSAVIASRGPGLGLGVWLQLASDGLEQVKRGQQALHRAVLVDDKHKTSGTGAELLEQGHGAEGLRHKGGRGGMRLDRAGRGRPKF